MSFIDQQVFLHIFGGQWSEVPRRTAIGNCGASISSVRRSGKIYELALENRLDSTSKSLKSVDRSRN